MSWLRTQIHVLISGDRIAAFADQGSLALIKFVALILFARWLSKEEFGIFALATAISYTAAGLQRALIVMPFIVSCPTVPLVRERGGHWFWLDHLLALAVTAALAVLYGLLPHLAAPGWLQQSVLYAVIGAPAVMTYEFTRRWLYQTKSYRAVLVIASANALTYAAGLIVVYFTRQEVWTAVLAFAAANFAGSLAARAVAPMPSLRTAKGMLGAWLKTRSFTGWQLLGSLLSQSGHHGLDLVVGALTGPVGIAVLTATRSLLRPLNTLFVSVDMIDKPRAGRALMQGGLPALTRSIRGMRRMLLVVGLPYLVLLFAFADEAIRLCFGVKYAGNVDELRILILVAAVGMLNQPLETRLVVLQKSRDLFFCKLASSITTYGIIAVLVSGHGIMGVILGIGGGAVVKQALLLVATRSLGKPPASPLGAAAMPRSPDGA